jgi:hypothetical protein
MRFTRALLGLRAAGLVALALVLCLAVPAQAAVRLDTASERLFRTATVPTYGDVSLLWWAYRVVDTGDFETLGGFFESGAGQALWIRIVGGSTDAPEVVNYTPTTDASDAGAWATGGWRRFALVFDNTANTLTLYEGSEDESTDMVQTAQVAETSGTQWDQIFLGGTLIGSGFSGRFANVKLYTEVLSTARLKQELAYYNIQVSTNIWGAWTLKEHTDLTDASGNGRSLSANGTVSTEAGPPITDGPETVALTGTVTASITESDIVTGGKTVILTVTDSTWVPAAGLGPSPTVRGIGAFGSGTTSFTAAVPTGGNAPVSGDAMYIIMESTDSTTTAGTPNTPSGWSKLFENTIAAGSSTEPAVSTTTIFGKIAGSSEANVTVDGVGNHCAGAMLVIAGHGLAAIGDTVVGSATNHGTSTANVLAPSITVTAGSLVIVVMGLGDDANDTTNVSGVTNANLASITERIDRTVSTGSGGGVGIYTATVAGTSTGTTEWDHDTAASSQSLQLGIPPPATTPFADARAAIRDGLDSAQSEGGGWDAKVKPNIPLNNIVRTSDTVVTITLQAQSDYDITAQETVTATVPDSALTGSGPVVATPTFTVDPGGGGAPAVPTRTLLGVGT